MYALIKGTGFVLQQVGNGALACGRAIKQFWLRCFDKQTEEDSDIPLVQMELDSGESGQGYSDYPSISTPSSPGVAAPPPKIFHANFASHVNKADENSEISFLSISSASNIIFPTASAAELPSTNASLETWSDWCSQKADEMTDWLQANWKRKGWDTVIGYTVTVKTFSLIMSVALPLWGDLPVNTMKTYLNYFLAVAALNWFTATVFSRPNYTDIISEFLEHLRYTSRIAEDANPITRFTVGLFFALVSIYDPDIGFQVQGMARKPLATFGKVDPDADYSQESYLTYISRPIIRSIHIFSSVVIPYKMITGIFEFFGKTEWYWKSAGFLFAVTAAYVSFLEANLTGDQEGITKRSQSSAAKTSKYYTALRDFIGTTATTSTFFINFVILMFGNDLTNYTDFILFALLPPAVTGLFDAIESNRFFENTLGKAMDTNNGIAIPTLRQIPVYDNNVEAMAYQASEQVLKGKKPTNCLLANLEMWGQFFTQRRKLPPNFNEYQPILRH